MPCSALQTRYCDCVQSSLHPSWQKVPRGVEKLGHLSRPGSQQAARSGFPLILLTAQPYTTPVLEHTDCAVSAFIGQGLYRVYEEMSQLTEFRKSPLTGQVKPGTMAKCFSCQIVSQSGIKPVFSSHNFSNTCLFLGCLLLQASPSFYCTQVSYLLSPQLMIHAPLLSSLVLSHSFASPSALSLPHLILSNKQILQANCNSFHFSSSPS